MNYFTVNNSVTFSIFTVLYDHYLYQVPKRPTENPITIKQSLSVLPSPQLLTTTSVYSDSVNVLTLGILYKRNHIRWGFR